MKCEIEIFFDNQWQQLATFTAMPLEIERGYSGGGMLLYEIPYAANYSNISDFRALSVNYPIDFEIHRLQTWPAFLLDLLPSGGGRRALLNLFEVDLQGEKADWFLLLNGASNPPGNLRIKQAATRLELEQDHPGFDKAEILTRQEHFIEYAKAHGAPIAGSSGAQGDAPKFLLTQDYHGKWHADGALADARSKCHWLVKFPRGHRRSDQAVLRNEFAYYEVAKTMGLRIHALPFYENNTLFVPRFDRLVSGQQVLRFGQESLCSAMGIADFGVTVPLEKMCQKIIRVCTDPKTELLEFIKRDILNILLGNTDNHARNTSLQKLLDGTVQLSPLYDFAPMVLDEEGIVRVCRWSGVDNSGDPIWAEVISLIIEILDDSRFSRTWLITALRSFGVSLKQLVSVMEQAGVDEDLIKRFTPKIKTAIKQLEQLK